MTHYDIIVVGGGPAGLTAAVYARRMGRSVLVLEREGFGGQIAASPRVENYPGYAAVSGAELAEKLLEQATALGADAELEEVTSVQDGQVKTVVTEYGVYTCTALILATGMKHRKLELEGEETLAGISFCAVCDGALYQGKDVAVCGGGNTALQDALFLSELCRHVTVIQRREAFRGDALLVQKLKARENVSFAMPAVITGLEGNEGRLTGLRLRNPASGAEERIAADALFEALGQLPETALSASVAEVDGAGFLPAGEDCVTSASGIFAAGDCRAKPVRQLTTACADGAVAALAACRYCERIRQG